MLLGGMRCAMRRPRRWQRMPHSFVTGSGIHNDATENLVACSPLTDVHTACPPLLNVSVLVHDCELLQPSAYPIPDVTW